MNARLHTLRVMASLAAGLVLACGEPTAAPPVLPVGSVPLIIPRVYAAWWKLTEACSQKTGDIAHVTWYHVPGARSIVVRGREYQGYWYRSTRTIVLAGQSVLDGPLVRHEMLHELSMAREHVREDFAVNCQGVVACESECVDEAGVPDVPAADAPEISLSELDLSVEVTPANPTMLADSGWVAIDVRVANPGAGAWMPLVPIQDNETTFATFGYVVQCLSSCAGGSKNQYTSDARFGLPAQSSRRMVFDRRLAVGTYIVRGTFNSDTTVGVTITVRPQ